MVECQLPKLEAWVRFPSPAPKEIIVCWIFHITHHQIQKNYCVIDVSTLQINSARCIFISIYYQLHSKKIRRNKYFILHTLNNWFCSGYFILLIISSNIIYNHHFQIIYVYRSFCIANFSKKNNTYVYYILHYYLIYIIKLLLVFNIYYISLTLYYIIHRYFKLHYY